MRNLTKRALKASLKQTLVSIPFIYPFFSWKRVSKLWLSGPALQRVHPSSLLDSSLTTSGGLVERSQEAVGVVCGMRGQIT